METKKKTKKAPVKPVSKPFLKGSVTDKTTPKTALILLGGVVVMAVANLLLTAALMWDNTLMRMFFNSLVLLVIYLMFFQSGASAGTVAVNHGEILYQRKEGGRSVEPQELARSYHPLKGFVAGMLGMLPLFVAAVILAVVAQRQMTGIGALPSWISNLQRRDEVGAALTYYNQLNPMTLEDTLRIVIRMTMMPYVNMVGTDNLDGLLVLERLSPVLALIPGLVYGWGYTRGVEMRSRVHTDIATGKRKRAKREKKRRQARARQAKGPEQLN